MLDAVLPDWHYNQQSYPSVSDYSSVFRAQQMPMSLPWREYNQGTVKECFRHLDLKGSCKDMLQQLLCCQHSANISLEGSVLAESLLNDVGQHLSGEKCPCTILAKRCYCRPLKRTCSHCNTVHLYHFQFH